MSGLSSALPLIAVSVTTGVLGQTAIKLGLSRAGATDLSLARIGSLLASIVSSPLVLLGLALYALGALAWIAVLSRLDLSYAYPFVALNFVLVAVVSQIALGEAVPALRWLGIALICLGIVVLAWSGSQ